MPSPFPGMDPYLETPDLWPDVHHGLIGHMQMALNSSIRPQYVARVEVRVYISDADDPGRASIIPDLRVETARSRKKRKRPKGNSAVSVIEPITIPWLIDDEINEAHIEIRHRESDALVTV